VSPQRFCGGAVYVEPLRAHGWTRHKSMRDDRGVLHTSMRHRRGTAAAGHNTSLCATIAAQPYIAQVYEGGITAAAQQHDGRAAYVYAP
jgi:hypothetical protein